jgi:thymidylate synthase ThyX
MKIINQSYEILSDLDLRKQIVLIERAGRTAYKSEDKITDDSAKEFATMITKRGHEAVLEHSFLSAKFTTDRGCCYSDDTEVLTDKGWKLFQELNGNERLAGLSDTGELVWDFPINIIANDFNGDLLEFSSTMIDLQVTDNHNMWVFDYDKRSKASRIWKFLQAHELSNRRYLFNRTATWAAPDIEVTIPAHPTKKHQFPELHYNKEQTGDLFELLGLWITDGHFYRKYNTGGQSIGISQTKATGVSRIKYLCDKLYLTYSYSLSKKQFRIDNLRLMNFIQDLWGDKAKTFTAFVPDLIKQASCGQINRFIEGVLLGDGTVHRKNGHRVIYTSSPAFADGLQELFLKIGHSANIRTISGRNRLFPLGQYSECKQSYVVSETRESRSKPLLDKRCAESFGRKIPYTGKVYCATVPTHRLYVRRNGIPVWCGNSHELVRHRLCSFTQESTRYCNYFKDKFNNQLTFIRPVWINENVCGTFNHPLIVDNLIDNKIIDGPDFVWITSISQSELNYLELLKRGWSPQQARSVLPNSLKTEIVISTNFREWKHIFQLRAVSKAAHPQMRDLMIPLYNYCRKELPEIFNMGDPE